MRPVIIYLSVATALSAACNRSAPLATDLTVVDAPPALANDPSGETGPIYDSRTVGQWVSMLKTDPDEVMKSAALTALQQAGPDAAVAAEAVAGFLNHRGIGVGLELAATMALEAMGTAAAVAAPALEAAMQPDAVAEPEFAQRLREEPAFVNAMKHTGAAKALLRVAPDRAPAVVRYLLADLNGPDYKGRNLLAPSVAVRLGAAAAPAVPALVTMLDSPDAARRRDAVACLSQFGEAAAPAVPAIARLLESRDPSDQKAVLAALRRLGPAAKAAVPNLLAELSRDSPRHDARDVATALGSIGPDAHAALGALDRFPEADSLDRLVFAVARAKIDPARTPAAVSQLFVAAYDTNPDRRMRALTIMSEVDFRPNEVLPVLALLVRDGDIGFAMQSATILTKMGPDAVPVLSAALRQSPPKNRRWIAVALGQMKPPAETAPALIGALADLSDQVRERARDALARMRPPPLRDLRAALTDPDRAKVVEVVRVFGAISPPPEQQVATLAGMLNDPSPAIRSAAIEALGHSARLARPAVPALRPFLKEPGLAEVAAEALFLIDPAGNPDALDVLAAGLRREPTVQTRCYLALRYAGPSAKSCLPAVKAAHDAEQNEHFKAALAKMMEAMAPGSSPPARPAE